MFPARKAKIHRMTSTDLFSWRQSERSVGMLKCQRYTWQNIPECSPTRGNVPFLKGLEETWLMVKGRVLASFHPTGTQAMVTVEVTEMCEPAWRTIQNQEGTMVSKTDSGAG